MPPWENGDQLLEQEGRSRYIPIVIQGLLFHTETGTTSTVFDVPDNLHGLTYSYRMRSFRCHQKAIFQSD